MQIFPGDGPRDGQGSGKHGQEQPGQGTKRQDTYAEAQCQLDAEPRGQGTAGNFPQAGGAEAVVEQPGRSEANDIARHAQPGQKRQQPRDLQNRCEDIAPDAVDLLAQALQKAVGDGIEIEKQDHRGKHGKVRPGPGAVINKRGQRLGEQMKQTGADTGKYSPGAETAVRQCADAPFFCLHPQAGELRDQQIHQGI